MKKIIHLSGICMLLCIAHWSCKKVDNWNQPLSASLGVPGPVTGIVVKNDSAKAILTYSLPANTDLAYVKAVYKLADSSVREVKASLYSNQLVVDGFGDTSEHVVQVYAVNKAEVVSTPVAVRVKPLENPIWGVFRNLIVSPDFAGVRIRSVNPSRSNISIEVYTDSLGDWVQYSGIYTSTDSINSSIRGLDTTARKFAILVRDRFLNRTDTLFTTLTPYYETAIPKSWYNPYTLPGDSKQQWSSNSLSYLWDGDIINWPNVYITTEDGNPGTYTFDIGRLCHLSRLVIWDYPEYLNGGRIYYYGANPKHFQIWGSASPNLNGSWDSWTMLGEYTETKPSTVPYGQNSSDDYNAGYAGFSWDLDPGAGKIRYLRIRCLENWSGNKAISTAEVQAYGDPR